MSRKRKTVIVNEYPLMEQIEQTLRQRIFGIGEEIKEYEHGMGKLADEEEKNGKLTSDQLKARIKFQLRLAERTAARAALSEIHTLHFKTWRVQQ